MAQYTVKKGDSPWSIAKANGISLKELSALNNNMDVNKTIYAGQKLNVSRDTAAGASQPTTAPTQNTAANQTQTGTNPTYTPSFTYKDYTPSDAVNSAQQRKTDAENALKNVGDFKYSGQGQLDSMIDQILNRKKFSYDLNGDVLYNQYKDQYQALGRTAMADTVAQASAMTGGYGNSYAATAGNQAYQQYLTQLNDKIPELYQLALSQYQQEGQDLLNNYNLLSNERQQEYGQYTDTLTRLQNDRNYYGEDYANEYNRDYGKYTNDREYNTTQYWNDYNAEYQRQRDAEADRQYAEQFAYKKQQDAIANQLARDQLNETIRNNRAAAAAKAASSSSSSKSSSKSSSGMKLTDTQIKELRKADYWEAIDAFRAQNPDASEEEIERKLKALGFTNEEINAYRSGVAQDYNAFKNITGFTGIMDAREFAQRKNANGGKVTAELTDGGTPVEFTNYQDYLKAMQEKYANGIPSGSKSSTRTKATTSKTKSGSSYSF